MIDNLEKLKAREISSLLKNRIISSLEVTEFFLNRIDKLNPEINALITIDKDGAIKQAKQIDKLFDNNENLSPLAGVPIVIKDNINVIGLPTTCASRMLANYISVYDSSVVEKLKQNGLVIIAKANMDEFSMGSSNEHSYFGNARNPIDTDKVPGGSSGGSAAAVASGMAPLALGSDTAGSVRQPSAFCGLVGMRPSYGRVSRYGLTAFASSFDQIGTITNDVIDNALLYRIISGHDKRDSTSIKKSSEFDLNSLKQDFNDIKIGLPRAFLNDIINPEIRDATNSIISQLIAEGTKIVDISLPETELCLAVYYILANSEASSNLSRFDGVRYGYRSEKADSLEEMYVNSRSEGFGDEVKRRILMGTYTLSSGFYDKYYRKAHKARQLITNKLKAVYEKCDLILMPSSPTTAFNINEKLANPLAMYLSDIFMTFAPMAGLPAISIPIGNDKSGMPIGLQLMGRYLDEISVFQYAAYLERMLHA